jgi:UrcA family protein
MKSAFIALAIALLAYPASAAPLQQSMSVKTSDLNLALEADQQAMNLRIHRVAKKLCESEALSQSLQMRRAERQCVKAAKAGTIAAVQRKTGVQAAGR